MALGPQLGIRRARKRRQYAAAVEQPREIVGAGTPRMNEGEVERKMAI